MTTEKKQFNKLHKQIKVHEATINELELAYERQHIHIDYLKEVIDFMLSGKPMWKLFMSKL